MADSVADKALAIPAERDRNLVEPCLQEGIAVLTHDKHLRHRTVVLVEDRVQVLQEHLVIEKRTLVECQLVLKEIRVWDEDELVDSPHKVESKIKSHAVDRSIIEEVTMSMEELVQDQP